MQKQFVKILKKNSRRISFQSDTLLLTDVFENFRNTFFKISELEPTKFLSARGLAWQAALQRPN